MATIRGQQTKEVKPLSCWWGIHSFPPLEMVYAHSMGAEQEFPLEATKCRYCGKWKFRQV